MIILYTQYIFFFLIHNLFIIYLRYKLYYNFNMYQMNNYQVRLFNNNQLNLMNLLDQHIMDLNL